MHISCIYLDIIFSNTLFQCNNIGVELCRQPILLLSHNKITVKLNFALYCATSKISVSYHEMSNLLLCVQEVVKYFSCVQNLALR